MPTTLIRDAQVVLPAQTVETNVLLEDSKIFAIDAARDQGADEVIEAEGLTLLPGVIDDQVHFREPGLTHKEDIATGSIGCAAGGITTFLEMPNTNPPAVDREHLQWKYDRAAKVSRVNYGFYIGATGDNVAELQDCDFAPGIKIFIGSSTGNLLVDQQEALERIFAETTLPICAHCEDETTVRNNRARLEAAGKLTIHDHSRIRDHEAAIVSTRRAIDLATRHQHRFHVLHVSTGAEVPEIKAAKPWITAEACPHHLFFSVEDYDRLGSLVQMNPSVKNPEDNVQVWQALMDNDIQVIATDHAPHTWKEKQQDYPASPSGLPAVENSLGLILRQVVDGKCTLQQVAAWMSDAPARVWGMVGKGRIEVGYDADLVLVDMNLEHDIINEKQFTKSRWSPWAGETLPTSVIRTLVGGKTVFMNGAVSLEAHGSPVRCDHGRGGYWNTHDGIGL
ncbi:MAG: dihydroorotase [Planctomycetota bacterium]|nr:dihydroorotase [Planctomycetota bacterium]